MKKFFLLNTFVVSILLTTAAQSGPIKLSTKNENLNKGAVVTVHYYNYSGSIEKKV